MTRFGLAGRQVAVAIVLTLAGGLLASGSGVASGSPGHASAAASVRVKVSPPKPAKGGWLVANLTVTNRGKKLSRMVVTARGKGVRVRPARTTFPSLAKGKKKRIRLRMKAAGGNRVTVTVRARGKVVGRATVRLRSTPPAPTLAGRYFYKKGVTSSDDRELYFSNAFVSTDPTDAGFPRCTAASASCLPYSWSPKSGVLTVGPDTGKATGGPMLELSGSTYFEAALQKPGARYSGEFMGSYANSACPYPGCYSVIYYLTLRADGTFSKSWQDSNLNYGEQEGTYRVLAGSLLKMTYTSDGEPGENTTYVAVRLNTAGKEDLANEGLIIGGIWYLPDD